MFFASETESDPIPVPGQPGHSIRVRMLSGKELELAEAEHIKAFQAGRSARGASATLNQIISGTATDADLAKVQRDPLRDVDRIVVARCGLTWWSFDRPIKPYAKPQTAQQKKDKTPAEIVDPIADMGNAALEFVATEVMRRTKPERFMTDEEQQDAQKND